jgi:hypothetical protein
MGHRMKVAKTKKSHILDEFLGEYIKIRTKLTDYVQIEDDIVEVGVVVSGKLIDYDETYLLISEEGPNDRQLIRQEDIGLMYIEDPTNAKPAGTSQLN